MRTAKRCTTKTDWTRRARIANARARYTNETHSQGSKTLRQSTDYGCTCQHGQVGACVVHPRHAGARSRLFPLQGRIPNLRHELTREASVGWRVLALRDERNHSAGHTALLESLAR